VLNGIASYDKREQVQQANEHLIYHKWYIGAKNTNKIYTDKHNVQ